MTSPVRDLLAGLDDAALERWLCRLLHCDQYCPGCPECPPAAAGPQPLVVIDGATTAGFAFTFNAHCANPTDASRTGDLVFTLDTGAFELLLPGTLGTQLGLPNLGPVEIAGVTGDAAAYYSQVTVTVTDRRTGQPVTLPDIRCVVDPSSQDALFGLRFFVDRGYQLILDPQQQWAAIVTGAGF